MKVCIVTVYDSMNCGSFWQAYILGEYLIKHGIDVYYYKVSKKESLTIIKEKTKDLFRELKKNGLVSFVHLSKSYRIFKSEQKKFRLVNKNDINDMDCFVLGSDTIWNIDKEKFFKNRRVFFGDVFPKDKKKMSYAASFANTSIEKIVSTKDVPNMLSNINNITVRDKRSAEIVEKITSEKCNIVCDPTLLFNKNDYKKYVGQRKEKDKYILLYLFKKLTSKQLCDLKNYAIGNNLKIIELSSSSSNGTNDILRVPENFINYFYYADIIITDTFHGTIFSINFDKNFYTINRNKNKVNEFLTSIGLEEFLVDDKFNFSKIEDNRDSYVDNKKLKELIEQSKKYLDNTILSKK